MKLRISLILAVAALVAWVLESLASSREEAPPTPMERENPPPEMYPPVVAVGFAVEVEPPRPGQVWA